MDTSVVLSSIKNDLKIVEKQLEKCVDFNHPSIRLSSQQMLKAGGKRIRPAFVLLAGKIYKKEATEYLVSLAAAVELVHMSTLIHDDIIDQSEFRRGKPSMRSIWGDKFSLHAGDYLFAQALKLIKPEDNKEITNILSRVSVEMCKGEINQLFTAFDTKQSVKDYLYKIKRKTALLIAVSCQIGALATKAPPSAINCLYKYGYYLGMAFQIKDDILDFTGDVQTLGKPVGSDLLQGILTLPTILILKEKNSASRRLKELIDNRFANGQRDIEEAIDIINNSGGVEKALEVSVRYINKAKEQLQYLPTNSITKNMAKLADHINKREV